MDRTLHEIIRSIESLPDYAEEAKRKGFDETLSAWEETVPAVKQIREGTTTFSEYYQQTFKPFYHRCDIPTEAISQEQLEEIALAQTIFGTTKKHKGLENYLTSTNGTVGGTILGVLAGSYLGRPLKKERYTRREIVDGMVKGMLFWGTLGAISGYILHSVSEDGITRQLSILEKNAEYLDQINDKYR